MIQREIKFRFWTPDKRMISDHEGWTEGIGINEALQYSKEYGYVIMQLTGLLDKKGICIYEGDIYQVAGNKKYIVSFLNGVSNYEWYGGCFGLKMIDKDEVFFPFDEWSMTNGEIIGNIYEHPHLLKP